MRRRLRCEKGTYKRAAVAAKARPIPICGASSSGAQFTGGTAQACYALGVVGSRDQEVTIPVQGADTARGGVLLDDCVRCDVGVCCRTWGQKSRGVGALDEADC